MADHSASSPDQSIALATLLQLIEDYHSFNPGGVATYPYPTALEFSKQANRGRPCVYRLDAKPFTSESQRGDRRETEGPDVLSERRRYLSDLETIKSCPAWSWTKDSLCAKVREDVEVAVTPDGRADSLYHLPRQYVPSNGNNGDQIHSDEEAEATEQVFVQPATVSMPLSLLLEKLCPASPLPSPTSPTSAPSSSTRSQSPNSPRSQSHNPPPSRNPNPPPANPPHRAQEPIYYLQSQNSNLTNTGLAPLLSELPSNMPFAGPVLGEPEATNIWIGNSASVTSTHRDPYENLYLVLNGTKTFTLWAPCEELCLHARKVRTAHHIHVHDHDYEQVNDHDHDHDQTTSGSSFSIALDHASELETETETDNRIPWIPIDPLNLPPPRVRASKYPFYQYSHPLTVTVSAGEILYLPAGWFHHVTQTCGVWADGEPAPCIAVNYWFDMDYEGEKYAMREMIGRLVETVNRDTG